MRSRLFVVAAALLSGCTLLTNLDGFAEAPERSALEGGVLESEGGGSFLDATSATDAPAADATVDAAVDAGCTLGTCPGPSVVVYANFDGGTFTLDIDQHVPAGIDLGFVALYPMHITLTGKYVADVKAVRFAGAATAAATSTVTGVSASIVTFVGDPSAPSDPAGTPTITCQYQGGAFYDPGCNTKQQIDAYFSSYFNAPVVVHGCQYEAYPTTMRLSDGALCRCLPLTCTQARSNCGQTSDGCGGQMECGACAAGTCGGFSKPNQCGGCGAGQTAIGPKLPTLVVDDATVGTVPWLTPMEIIARDGVRAEPAAGLSSNQVSHYLKATGFNFQVPMNSQIKGVYVEVERSSYAGVGIVDEAVRIVKGGAFGASNHKSAAEWPLREQVDNPRDFVAMYGGPADTWGETLLWSDVNAASFGAALAVKYPNAAGNDIPLVDALRMYVCVQ